MITKTITVAGVNIDIYDGPIGISLSGGADSAILLHILLTHATGPVHAFSCASKAKHRVVPHIAITVIDKCMDLTGNTNVQHHTYFVEQQTLPTWFDGLLKGIATFNLNMMYTGVTSLPPDQVLKTFKTPTPLYDKRDPNQVRPRYHNNNTVHTPMFNVDKQQVAAMYKELGVLDELYPLTRSCESWTLTSGHCGTCWWCEERQWGFGRLK